MPEFDWSKYELLRDQGVPEHAVYLHARDDGVGFLESWRMLKDVFGVDLHRAKEISLQADGVANSLKEHEASWLPAIEEFVRQIENEAGDES